MAFTKDPNPANIDANYIYTSTASYTPAALPESGDDGIRYLFIRTKDNVGNLSGWENMFTYVYDTTPPLGVRNESIVEIHGVKSGIPQGKVNHPTFRWTAPDDPRPITYDLYWVEAGEDGCGDPGTTFMHVNEPEVTYEDWPELGMEKAGAKCLLVFAVDEAGNRSEQYATFVFILSETPPILKITDFTSQPEVTSLGKADMFTVNGRKKIIYGKDFVGTITITVSTGTSDDQTVNEGIKSIQFPSLFGDLGETISFDPATYLTDTYSYEYFVPAGATHAGSFNVTLTTENGTKIHAPFDLICESSAPLISDLNLNSGLFASFVVGDILYHGESSYGTLTVSVNATEPEPDANNGYSKVDVVIFPSLASSDTSSDDTSPYSHTWSPITLTGEDDGIYTITAIDNFGNSSFKTFQIISDSTGPDVILDISDAPGMVFIVNWSAHDRDVAPGIPGSGVDHYQARLVPANTSCDSISVIAELDNGSTQKTSVEIADSGVNTPKLCVRAYDRVGNAGAWAEKQPEVVTETAYYPFNGQSVAMSRNGQTYYFGTDHLGSISVTVRQDGTVASEMRYEPYGQVRWIKGTVLSDKSYTGQRSESGFGLMDYNARYYDPSIMQFQQPDTLVPDPYNPLDWNRYSYARYNPIKYTDPTGHGTVCYEDGYCGDAPIYSKEHLDYLRRLYGIVFMGSWDSGDDSNKDQWSVVFGVQAMAEGLSGRSGGNAASTFRQVYGIANGQKFNFEWGCSECIGFAITMGPRHIKFGGMYTNPLSNVTLVVHELFHAFENAMLPDGADFKEARNALPDNIVNGDGLMPPTDRRWQHRIDGDGRGEIFADMGVGWIFDAWNLLGNQLTVDAANAKRDWMNQQMGEYIQSAISNQRQ